MAPMFKHDCKRSDCCEYVGSTNEGDVYLTFSGSVILRVGDDGPEYISAPPFTLGAILKDPEREMHVPVKMALRLM